MIRRCNTIYCTTTKLNTLLIAKKIVKIIYKRLRLQVCTLLLSQFFLTALALVLVLVLASSLALRGPFSKLLRRMSNSVHRSLASK